MTESCEINIFTVILLICYRNLKNVSKTEHPVKDRNQMTAFIRFKSIRDLKIGQRKAEKIGKQYTRQ